MTNENALDKIPPLSSGAHTDLTEGACVMEAVAFVAGEEWSDYPACACPVIGRFLRSWNDALPDAERDGLLRGLIPLLVNTKGPVALEQRRAVMAADWLSRAYTPAWLQLAGMTEQALALSSLPEIIDFTQCAILMPVLNAVRADADAVRAAARAAAAYAAADDAWDAAWDAASAAASAAAGDAALAAARGAARGAAGVAILDSAWAVGWGAVGAAARAAARDAARDPIKSTRAELQKSALKLVRRMIDAK